MPDQNEEKKSETPQIQPEQSKEAAEPAGANEPAQPQTSERKKQANRENAKRSTGPRTMRGKDMIRFNALKHGLYASDVVIRHGAAQESQEEFDILLEGLQRAWEPTNVMQHCLVRTIAEAEWRLRRARRAEVGEIRRNADSYYDQLLIGYGEDLGVVGASISSRPDRDQAARNMTCSIHLKLKQLAEVRKAVELHGYVSDGFQQDLDRMFGKDDLLATQCHRISYLARSQKSEGKSSDAGVEGPTDTCPSEDSLNADDYKQMLLVFINARAAVLQQSLENISQAAEWEYQATLLYKSLPSKEFIDKLVRYETALERQKEKAINTLLKLKAKMRNLPERSQ
jgi:hypothetical protein